ncbi:MAG: DUF268 domain-containing protein [Candidatus Polarisedimenticolia bacterium]|nr:DUF268 domain-containing protein [bacterium]
MKMFGLTARLRRVAHELRDARRFRREFEAFAAASAARPARFSVSWDDRFPCLADRTATTGFDRHYVYHTAWAARVLAATRPGRHVDIGSSLYFAALASAFVPMEFYDVRPAELELDGLRCGAADLQRLPFADRSIESLSCMHVLEHVGLGRYGDSLDPDGDSRAAEELGRVLAANGQLLLVVPVGRPRVRFNAHRIYSLGQVSGMFPCLQLKEFALVPDDPRDGGLLRGAEAAAERQDYGCGCFRFVRQ